MSNTPFMQLWVSDFLGDTQHLSQKEVGSYLLLLMAMFNNKGTLPKDEKRLKRIARGAVSDAVMAFFEDDEQGGITQARLQKECKKAQEKHAARVACGRAGGLANALKNKKPDLAKATVSLKHLPEPEPEPEPDSKKERKSGAIAPLPSEKDFNIFWLEYPHKVGKRDALKAFLSSLQRAPLLEILDGVRRYIRTKPPDRPWCNPATWLNQDRWLDEPGPEVRSDKRSGLRAALDKLGGEDAPRLGTLSEFLAIPSNGAGGAGVDCPQIDVRASKAGSKIDSLGISKGDEP
jgi:uncharacterized protein YdaU (DUF1376 family)